MIVSRQLVFLNWELGFRHSHVINLSLWLIPLPGELRAQVWNTNTKMSNGFIFSKCYLRSHWKKAQVGSFWVNHFILLFLFRVLYFFTKKEISQLNRLANTVHWKIAREVMDESGDYLKLMLLDEGEIHSKSTYSISTNWVWVVRLSRQLGPQVLRWCEKRQDGLRRARNCQECPPLLFPHSLSSWCLLSADYRSVFKGRVPGACWAIEHYSMKG